MEAAKSKGSPLTAAVSFNLIRNDTNTAKPYAKRVFLPSTMHPTFCEILHHDKLLNIVSDLVRLFLACHLEIVYKPK